MTTTTCDITRQSWDKASLLSRDSWHMQLPGDVAAEFVAFVQANPGIEANTLELDPASLPALARFAEGVRENVRDGDGVAWIQGLDRLGLQVEKEKLFYAAFAYAMGTPMRNYGLLYPIRDRGVDYRDTALPVSMTNAETSYHTDSSSVDVVPDFVGLYCECPSDNGGESLVSNALHAYAQLRETDPDAVARLEEALVRDVVTPGAEKNHETLLRNRFPVFAGAPDRREGLLFRYMRYWIERGQERAGSPLSDEQLRALDLLDERLTDPENVVSFHLRKGDILWVNNRTLAHNRTAFQDTAGNQRVLHRVWLAARPSGWNEIGSGEPQANG